MNRTRTTKLTAHQRPSDYRFSKFIPYISFRSTIRGIIDPSESMIPSIQVRDFFRVSPPSCSTGSAAAAALKPGRPGHRISCYRSRFIGRVY